MNDNEIIKALECCASSCSSEACRNCPFDKEDCCTENENALAIYALDLINRQKAGIERLEKLADYQAKDIEVWRQKYEEAVKNLLGLADTASNEMKRAEGEAIKEFAERLKEEFHVDTQRYNENTNSFIRILTSTIDVLVKEMAGEQE